MEKSLYRTPYSDVSTFIAPIRESGGSISMVGMRIGKCGESDVNYRMGLTKRPLIRHKPHISQDVPTHAYRLMM